MVHVKAASIALLGSILVAGCAAPEPAGLAEGAWRAWLDSPGGELPFGLEVTRDHDALQIVIVNGSERIRVPRVEEDGARLVLGLEPYDSTIVASLDRDGMRLSGRWEKTTGPGQLASLVQQWPAAAFICAFVCHPLLPRLSCSRRLA